MGLSFNNQGRFSMQGHETGCVRLMPLASGQLGARFMLRVAMLLGLLVLGGGLTPSVGQAQIFSPGDLNKAHASLDSMTSCDQCHTGQKQVDRNKCLSCHELVEKSIRARDGLHGQPAVRAQECIECHTDHKGKDASIVKWPGGRQERFPHQKSGWPLKGEHGNQECKKCHEPARIVSPIVLSYLQKVKKKNTFMGLETDCTDCHFDEHRKQFTETCDKCHDELDWEKPPLFSHAKYWKLEGAHNKVDCEKCHESVKDSSFNANAFPKPRAATFMKMKDIEHEQCVDCHTDPHKGKFGNNCLKCHNNESWAVGENSRAVQDVSFHDKTAFPLKGKHQAVDCDTCHPKDRTGMKILKPIAHDTCATCHPSAHPEVSAEGAGQNMNQACETCHSVDGFELVTFSIEEHDKTRYPLQESHRAVSCTECHEQGASGGPARVFGPARDPGKPQPVKNFMATRVLSSWLLQVFEVPHGMMGENCQSCHATPHGNQFDDKKCAECHTQTTWKMASTFDHSKTRYPLDGKHKEVACSLCHATEQTSQGAMVHYKPLKTDDCTPCHGDAHYGQFSKLTPALDCKQCHQVSGFKNVLFQHNQPAFSDFALEGKHEGARCEGCHTTVTLQSGVSVQRFRPTPKECSTCHVDQHKGAYQKAAQLVRGGERDLTTGRASSKVGNSTSGIAAAAGPTDTQALIAAAWSAPAGWGHGDPALATSCDVCHESKGWNRIHFDHAATGFPLKGQHKDTPCQSCHVPGKNEKLPTDCSGCHENVHQGEVAFTCQECHNEQSFRRTILPVTRHARTSFPLLGRHATANCRECHTDVRSVGFEQTPSECVACHEPAIPVASATVVDHSTFPSSCEQCHTPITWKAANYLSHGSCFPIQRGSNHAGIACSSCHPSGIPAVSGTCSDTSATCVSCHGCEEAEHRQVRGYECEDRKCYQCHPGGTG